VYSPNDNTILLEIWDFWSLLVIINITNMIILTVLAITTAAATIRPTTICFAQVLVTRLQYDGFASPALRQSLFIVELLCRLLYHYTYISLLVRCRAYATSSLTGCDETFGWLLATQLKMAPNDDARSSSSSSKAASSSAVIESPLNTAVRRQRWIVAFKHNVNCQ